MIYDITVSKIWCVMCANKIKSAFQGQNGSNIKGVQYLYVNVIAEKIIISIDQSLISLEEVRQILEKNNFTIVGQPRLVNADSNKQRSIKLLLTYQTIEFEEIQSAVQKVIDLYQQSIVSQSYENINDNKKILVITYKPLMEFAHQIYKSLIGELSKLNQETNQKYIAVKIINEVLQKFSQKKVMQEGVNKRKLLLAIVISFFYLIFSMILPNFEELEQFMLYPDNNTVFSIYLLLLLSLTLFTLYTFGLSTYKRAYLLFKQHRMFNMDTLLTMGTLSAFFMSIFLIIIYTTQNCLSHTYMKNNHMEKMDQIMDIINYFESAGLILTVVTVGKYLEGKAKERIIRMQEQIFPEQQLLKTTYVSLIKGSSQNYDINSAQQCEISFLEKGDLIQLKQDMKLLLDGEDSFEATQGQRIKSGADIISGDAVFQVEEVLESSMLLQIANQLNLAQSESQEQEDGISAILKSASQKFVLGVIILSTFVLITWIIIIYFDQIEVDEFCIWCFPIERAISILVASCPCALGLAVPSVVVISLNMALKSGILIKKNTIFQQINKVKVIVFDKTGTLFTKIDHINSFTTLRNHQTQYFDKKGQYLRSESKKRKPKKVDENQELIETLESEKSQRIQQNALQVQDLWSIICLIEKEFKQHPIANLLYKESLSKFNLKDIQYQLVDQAVQEQSGVKAKLIKNGAQLQCLIGSKQHMIQNNIYIDDQTDYLCKQFQFNGQTTILLAIDNNLEALISIDNKPNLRPEAKQVIQYLRQKLRKIVYIISGDSQQIINDVGNYLGIPQEFLYGETDAEGKKRLLLQLKSIKQEVMMIGDGLNDILSLQQACVGVSINAKSELNLIASDVILLNSNLWSIVILIQLMKTANRYVLINLIWAFGYNLFMAPIAAGVFHNQGFTINPMISSMAMSFSSILVVLISNTMRLMNFDPSDQRGLQYENIPFDLKNSFSTFSQPEDI
ncbi:hypothetical protein pb186bvf_020457 [Paramecium bursaria]